MAGLAGRNATGRAVIQLEGVFWQISAGPFRQAMNESASLRDLMARFDDIDGLEMPDLEAVRAEALGFARDLMRLDPLRKDWSTSRVLVTDENEAVVIEIPFAEAIRANEG